MSNNTDHDANSDDQDWLDTLAGKPPSKSNTDTRQDAQRLRTALLQHRLNTKATTTADFDKLRSRLQQEGALKSEKPSFSVQMLLSYLRAYLQPIAVTTALILVSVSLTLLLSRPDSLMTPKSDLATVTLPIRVEHPQQSAQALQARLAGLPQHTQVSQQADYWQITLTLSSQLSAADLENLLAILSDYGAFMLYSDVTTVVVQFFPPAASYVYYRQTGAPAEEAERIQQELQQLGIPVQRQPSGDTVWLDIEIPLPLTEDILSLLDSYDWDAGVVVRFEGQIQLQLHP